MEVTFTNLSFGVITNTVWYFGDGFISHDLSPTHTYTNQGVYDVSLTVSGPEGTDTETSTNYITVLAGLKADFTGSPLNGAPPLDVAFTNRSQGAIDWYLWDFGDGATSSDLHPSHSFQSNGTYNVSLTVGNADATNSLIRSNYVSVTDFAVHSTSPSNGDWAVTVATNIRVPLYDQRQ